MRILARRRAVPFLVVCVAALAALATGLARGVARAEEPPRVITYRSPTCGCCEKWADHLEAAGFSVELREVRDVAPVKAAHGVPPALAACHTALVDGYVVEGHVPAADVRRLLDERPAIRGLAVPGMPEGSPGMEGPEPERYRVLTFDEQGDVGVFATHGP